jgi:gp16 family phage-associated protein
MRQPWPAKQGETMKSIEQVRKEFADSGMSVTRWAISHGLSPQAVFDILRGKRLGKRGDGHKAAVLLGIKKGTLEKKEAAA